MTPQEIRAALKLVDVKQTEIARELNIASSTVATVISGRCTSKRIFKAIAKAIGKPVSEVFPKRTA